MMVESMLQFLVFLSFVKRDEAFLSMKRRRGPPFPAMVVYARYAL